MKIFKLFSVLFLIAFLPSLAFSVVKPERKHKLTILAYMNGHEKIVDPVVEMLINQMEEVGSTNDMVIAAEWGSVRTGKTKRLHIKKDSDMTRVTSDVLQESEADMGDFATLNEFLLWGAARYPSENLIVVLGGHGSGWSGFSFDERAKTRIMIPKVGEALMNLSRQRGQKTDLVVFDSCLMSMIEVAAELSPSVKLMAGAMDKLPDDVWVPYDRAFAGIQNLAFFDAEKAGAVFADTYYELTKDLSHSDGILGIQFGVVDLSKIDRVLRTAQEFVGEVLALQRSDRKFVVDTLVQPLQKYYFKWYVDLADWAKSVSQETRFASLAPIALRLQSELAGLLSYQAKTAYYPNASGLTVSLLPERPLDWKVKYSALRWSKETGWGALLDQLDAEK